MGFHYQTLRGVAMHPRLMRLLFPQVALISVPCKTRHVGRVSMFYMQGASCCICYVARSNTARSDTRRHRDIQRGVRLTTLESSKHDQHTQTAATASNHESSKRHTMQTRKSSAQDQREQEQAFEQPQQQTRQLHGNDDEDDDTTSTTMTTT